MAGYGSDSGLTDWLTANGYTLPDGTPASAVLRERGSAYIDSTYGMRFPGVPTGGISQDRAWPRKGATIYGSAIASTVVPQRVIDASYMAAYIVATNPYSLTVTFDPAKRVKRQKVDTIEREFFEPSDSMNVFAPNAPVNSEIEGILAPLIGAATGMPAALVV